MNKQRANALLELAADLRRDNKAQLKQFRRMERQNLAAYKKVVDELIEAREALDARQNDLSRAMKQRNDASGELETQKQKVADLELRVEQIQIGMVDFALGNLKREDLHLFLEEEQFKRIEGAI